MSSHPLPRTARDAQRPPGERLAEPSAADVAAFASGDHVRLYRWMGAHLGDAGATFRVWAPNATHVDVIGDFNDWIAGRDRLQRRDDGSGVWEGFARDAGHGMRYKYRVETRDGATDKADPFAVFAECPPRTASRLWSLDHAWSDAAWMATRAAAGSLARRQWSASE